MSSEGFARRADGEVSASDSVHWVQQPTDAWLDTLAAHDVPLLTGASGAAVVFQARARLIGETPSLEQVLSIVRELRTNLDGIRTRSEDALPGEVESPRLGTLVFAIDSEAGEYVLWFSTRSAQNGEDAPDTRDVASPWSAADRVRAANVTYAVLVKTKREVAGMVARVHEEQRGRARATVAIGHELRNSLGILGGWTDVLRARLPRTEQASRAVDVIDRTVRIQRKLVDDLVETSLHGLGAVALDRRELAVAGLVEHMLDACRPATDEKQLRVEVQLEPELGVVRGDAERLGQVLGNVLANAVKFTPAGGIVRVSARRSERHIEICVSDTGIGISSDFLPHVFDAFRRADPDPKRSGGLGLGLTIAKQLIELHGGQIVAESQGSGAGATFRILLPA